MSIVLSFIYLNEDALYCIGKSINEFLQKILLTKRAVDFGFNKMLWNTIDKCISKFT